ncbi:MAG: RNA polymerase factor sigma-54 [Gammaproteobacteria bacterium]|nr:RNA polymerase factor sigma-54 [Gammaproteobacteria bacterium]
MNQPSLVLQQRLQTNLTPELRQAIRMMQLSAAQLEQEIRAECAVNPFLEVADDIDSVIEDINDEPQDEQSEHDLEHDYEDDPYEDVQPQATTHDREDVATVIDNDASADLSSLKLNVETEWSDLYLADGNEASSVDGQALASYSTSLQEHLQEQLNQFGIAKQAHGIVGYLIDAVGEDGYIFNWEELVSESQESLNVSVAQLESGLKVLQSMAPAGVGARSVQECLLLQLQAFPKGKESRDLALTIVSNHFHCLANQTHQQIQTVLQVEESKIVDAIELIQSLHPRPGAAFANVDPLYIVPDVLVSKQDGEWTVTLNDKVSPTVRINQEYKTLNRSSLSTKDRSYFREYLHRAQALIYGINRRKETLLKVALMIVEEQKEFFERGELFMRPMAQSDLASMVGVHTSTISRITTEKYLLCARGTFELKYFFSSALRAHRGDDVSSTTIRAMIQRWTDNEDPTHPLTDTAIAERLKDRQISIARRTVTKYRESLQIPAVQHRRVRI